jgi:hypothetical protein
VPPGYALLYAAAMALLARIVVTSGAKKET